MPNQLREGVIKLRNLPRKGLIADFSGVELNQLVEFSSNDFYDLTIWNMQIEKILKRAEELNAAFEVYEMGSNEVSKTDLYLMKFVNNPSHLHE